MYRDRGRALELALCAVLLGGAAVRGQADVEEFDFPLLNRTYEGFIEELVPLEMGAAKVALRSPEHSLSVITHRATLTRSGDGYHEANLELEFSAAGRLEADVSMAGVKGHLGDDLVAPRQRLTVAGRIRVERGNAGYWITPISWPAQLEVAIESQLAKRLFGLCHQLTLVLVRLDCVTLERSLSSVSVPLPPPGEPYLLSDEELRPEDRRKLDAYLAVGRPGVPAAEP